MSGLKCMAYPNGIPEEFLTGEKNHDKIEPGQEGDFVFQEEENI